MRHNNLHCADTHTCICTCATHSIYSVYLYNTSSSVPHHHRHCDSCHQHHHWDYTCHYSCNICRWWVICTSMCTWKLYMSVKWLQRRQVCARILLSESSQHRVLTVCLLYQLTRWGVYICSIKFQCSCRPFFKFAVTVPSKNCEGEFLRLINSESDRELSSGGAVVNDSQCWVIILSIDEDTWCQWTVLWKFTINSHLWSSHKYVG